jgi:hypothetical protein
MIGGLHKHNRPCEEKQAASANCTKLYWDDVNRLQAKTVTGVYRELLPRLNSLPKRPFLCAIKKPNTTLATLIHPLPITQPWSAAS